MPAPILRRAARFFSYTPLLGFSAALSFIKLLLYAHLVQADAFGELSQTLLISSLFCVFGSLGVELLAHRELPKLFAYRRFRRACTLITMGLYVTTAMGLAAAVIGLLVSLYVLKISWIVPIVGLTHGWAQQVFLLSLIESRSRLDMMRYARQALLRTILTISAGATALYAGAGVIGAVLAEAGVTLAIFLYLIPTTWRACDLALSTQFKLAARGLSKMDWRASGTLLLNNLVSFFSFGADRWLATAYLTLTQFGHYSFAWMALAASQSAQFLLNAGIFPLLAHREATRPGKGARKLAIAVSLGLVVAGGILAVLLFPVARIAIAKLYPQHVEALPLLLPLMLAAVFRLSDFWSSYLIIMKRERVVLIIQAAVLVASVSAWAIWTLTGWSQPSAHSFSLLALATATLSYVCLAAATFTLRVHEP